MKKFTIAILFLLFLIFPFITFAKIGVGVATGKIKVDQQLTPGLIYTLPPLTVLNTGDEPSDYGVTIQFKDKQPEMRPEKEWFSFEPSSFHLEPGAIQSVQIKLKLPIRGVKPGDYFAFLQAYPEAKVQEGKTSIGVAAAAKLYFTVRPANIFVGFYYRLKSLYQIYYPWSLIVVIIVMATLLIAIFRKFFHFNIGVSVKKKNE